jgi:hypothetical protein
MSLLEKVKGLTLAIVENFSSQNVECILLHGSVLFNPHINPQDVDLVIVLRNKKNDDCVTLGKIFRELMGSFPPLIQLHLVYLFELPHQAKLFSIHTSGCFFVQHLRQALTLYGSNVFYNLGDASQEELLTSLLQKVQQYTSTLRNNIAYQSALTTTDLRQAQKRTVVVMKDLLMSRGILLQQQDEIITESLRRFSEFDEREEEFLRKIVLVDYQLPNLQDSSIFFLQCLAIHEKAYSLLRQWISQELRADFFES